MNMHNKLPDPGGASVYGFPSVAGETGVDARRGWLRPLIIVLLIAAAAFGLSKLFGGKPAAPAAADPIPQVTVLVPGTTTVASSVTATGSIAARHDSAVGVQGDGGRVIAVLVDPGQSVARGQVLARIDRDVAVQQVAQLAAGIRTSEADTRLAEAELKRAEALVDKGFISKSDIDKRAATRDGALARVAVARAQLAEAQARLARLDIRAPSAGLVLARSVEVGQVVGPGTGAMFRIADGGVLEMRALVAEQDMAALRVGMAADVTPVGSTTTYPGKVWLLDPVIDAASRQGVARIAVAYAPGLRVGAFAKTVIKGGSAARPVLPQSAVLSDARGNFVYVVGAGKKVMRRAITVGAVSDAGVGIASGLDGSERVVVSAGAFLREGEPVNPVIAAATPR